MARRNTSPVKVSKQENSIEEMVSFSSSDDNSYKQWSVGKNGQYIPCFNTVLNVPAGIYEPKYSQGIGFYIEKQNHIISDDLLNLPMKEIDEILNNIKDFWERENIFKKYGYTHKRGILLYGPPGNGKSYLIQSLCQQLINEMKGIVLNLKDYESVELFLEFAGTIIRQIEKKTPIIVVMEDIDNILEYNHSIVTKLLNLLDGVKQIDKVVYVATTNYPERLQERISNRPSRFDRRYKINKPDAKIREFYIKNKLEKDDLKKIDLKKWVSETKGLSISHLKELIVSVIILGLTFEETINKLKDMSNQISSTEPSENGKVRIGFSNNHNINENIIDEK